MVAALLPSEDGPFDFKTCCFPVILSLLPPGIVPYSPRDQSRWRRLLGDRRFGHFSEPPPDGAPWNQSPMLLFAHRRRFHNFLLQNCDVEALTGSELLLRTSEYSRNFITSSQGDFRVFRHFCNFAIIFSKKKDPAESSN